MNKKFSLSLCLILVACSPFKKDESTFGDFTKNGYKEISEVFNQPIKGDIYIITKTSTHKYGHIAGYDGSQWILNFKQKSQVIYRDKVDYRYFRVQ